MTARQFYDEKIKMDNTIGSVQLMEEFAKHVMSDKLCKGTPIDFDENKISDLKQINKAVNELCDYVNS